MNSRLIFISNEKRIKRLESFWGKSDLFAGDYVFKLSELTKEQKRFFIELSTSFSPFISVKYQDSDELALKIIPDANFLQKLKQTNTGDVNVDLFKEKVVKYFTPSQKKCWKYRHITIDFNKSPLIMGILNATPDSFSDGGKFFEKNKAIDHALELFEKGADIVDIGGESTRPGAEPVSSAEEKRRIIPVIESISKHSDCIISVDTYKSDVAESALAAGAHIINDISGMVFDVKMKDTVDHYKCPVIVMHIKGTPRDMQLNPVYGNLHREVYEFLEKKAAEAGTLNNGQVIIDPGFGFGKTADHNFELLRDLKDFTFLDNPILAGVSRKSFIGKSLQTDVNNRIIGSVSSEIYAYLSGADIWRVHDVEETVQAKTIINDILTA